MKRGKYPCGNADDQRHTQRYEAELKGDRETLPDQLGDRKVFVFERGSEITMRESTKVACELRPNRPVQSVGALKICHDFGGQGLFLIKRAAGGCSHQKKSYRDNDEQRRN